MDYSVNSQTHNNDPSPLLKHNHNSNNATRKSKHATIKEMQYLKHECNAVLKHECNAITPLPNLIPRPKYKLPNDLDSILDSTRTKRKHSKGGASCYTSRDPSHHGALHLTTLNTPDHKHTSHMAGKHHSGN